MCSTEKEMREEAKVKSERWSFSSAVRKSAIEVGLHRGMARGLWWSVLAFLTPILD